MKRICRFCKSNTREYSHGHGWCGVHMHIVDDNYSCNDFHYIECCESCHYYHDGCVKDHVVMYTDRCMCKDEYEEKINL